MLAQFWNDRDLLLIACLLAVAVYLTGSLLWGKPCELPKMEH